MDACVRASRTAPELRRRSIQGNSAESTRSQPPYALLETRGHGYSPTPHIYGHYTGSPAGLAPLNLRSQAFAPVRKLA